MIRSLIAKPWEARALAAGATLIVRPLKVQPEFSRHHLPVRPEPRSDRRWVFMCRTDFPSYSWATADFTAPFAAGDTLAVKEAWCETEHGIAYKADWGIEQNWKPAITMPAWAVRTRPIVESVKVRRVRSITEDEAVTTGCGDNDPGKFAWWDDGGNPRGGCALDNFEYCFGPNAFYADPWCIFGRVRHV